MNKVSKVTKVLFIQFYRSSVNPPLVIFGYTNLNFMYPKVQKFEELIVWKEARQLNKHLFLELKDCKVFFFRDQILRASLSVSSNIAEGFERQTPKEFARFLYIARASCGEVRSQLYLGMDTDIIAKEKAEPLIDHCKRISYLLFKLIKSIS